MFCCWWFIHVSEPQWNHEYDGEVDVAVLSSWLLLRLFPDFSTHPSSFNGEYVNYLQMVVDQWRVLLRQ